MRVIEWLCGIWALGLGARMTLELILCDGWIHVPKNHVNIFFDFGTLAVLGMLVTVIITRELIIEARKKLEAKENA